MAIHFCYMPLISFSHTGRQSNCYHNVINEKAEQKVEKSAPGDPEDKTERRDYCSYFLTGEPKNDLSPLKENGTIFS